MPNYVELATASRVAHYAELDETKKEKLAAAKDGIKKLDEAYRAYFKDRGLSAVMVPAFPGEPIKTDAAGLANFPLFTFTFGMNEL